MFTQEQLQTALSRHEIIAPLMQEGLEPAEKRKRRYEIMQKYDISERSLRRYIAAYRQEGYVGLTRKKRNDSGQGRVINEEILSAAIELREELPQRSIRAIKKILESEGLATKDQIKRSTLDEQLRKNGYSKKDMKFKSNGTTARRFVRVGRNTCWQSDVKYGPYIPSKDGKMKRTYLIVFIDDATRLVTHAQFYDNQRLPILENAFKRAVLKYGKPDDIYVDNGKIFVSNWFKMACMKLGIRHLKAKPYSPASKGKVEKFNNFVDGFLAELSLEPAKTLDELNHKWKLWLDDEYNHKSHSGINGKTPVEAYIQDKKAVRLANVEDLYDAFIHETQARVDKTGCLKLQGIEFEAGSAYCGKKVLVRFDPFELSEIELYVDGEFKSRLKPHKPAEFCGTTANTEPVKKVKYSRMLAACEKGHDSRKESSTGAITFRSMKGGDSHV
jgi:transposase InsO family protein